MKLLYATDGEIVHSYWDEVWPRVVGKDEFSIFSVDETDENRLLCNDLSIYAGKYNSLGQTKYYIDGDGDLAERDGWVEQAEDL